MADSEKGKGGVGGTEPRHGWSHQGRPFWLCTSGFAKGAYLALAHYPWLTQVWVAEAPDLLLPCSSHRMQEEAVQKAGSAGSGSDCDAQIGAGSRHRNGSCPPLLLSPAEPSSLSNCSPQLELLGQ